MSVTRYADPGDTRIVNVPEPASPDEGMVVLKMLMGFVCSTDVSLFRRTDHFTLVENCTQFFAQ